MVLVKGFYDRGLTIVLLVSALGGGLVTELLGPPAERPPIGRSWLGVVQSPAGRWAVRHRVRWQAARTGWVAASQAFDIRVPTPHQDLAARATPSAIARHTALDNPWLPSHCIW